MTLEIARAEAAETAPGTRGGILVVDDQRLIALDLELALRTMGYTVAGVARSGENAIEKAKELSPDLVLMDIWMPGLIDGIEAAAFIKQSMDIPVVYLSAFSDDETLTRAKRTDPFGFVTKPFREADLRCAIEVALERHAREGILRAAPLVQAAPPATVEGEAAAITSQAVHLLDVDLERRITERTAHLAAANEDLDAFSLAVSHDLRAPLQAIDAFSQALLEDHAGRLDPEAQDYLRRLRTTTQRMGHLVDDLMGLARGARQELRRTSVDLSLVAREVAAELAEAHPERSVDIVIRKGALASCDLGLARILLEHLLANAWQATSDRLLGRLTFGCSDDGPSRVFFLRDNGVGFDKVFGGQLFRTLLPQRRPGESQGTGVGLATIQRIVTRHGGRVWAEGEEGRGATFFFTLT